MREWPMNWRSDRGIMERICPHGVGHIDPDDAAYRKTIHPPYPGQEINDMIHNQLPAGIWIRWFDDGMHGCDLCCVAGDISVE